MADQAMSADCTTVIGSDVVIKGEMTLEKGLRVDGTIEGSITTKGKVTLGKGGTLKADVCAGNLTCEGKIEGNVTVSDRFQIEASASVKGDITAGKLTVAEGATLCGNIHIGPEEVQESSKEATASGTVRLNALGSSVGTHKASAAAAV